MIVFDEAKLLRDKKINLIIEQQELECPFTPKISNNEEPKVENFYNRLQDWMEVKHEKMARY